MAPREAVRVADQSGVPSRRAAKRRAATPSEFPFADLPDLDQSKPVKVKSYTRKDGTFVRGHSRRLPRS